MASDLKGTDRTPVSASVGKLSSGQLHAYASALVEIAAIRKAMASRVEKLPSDQASILKTQADAEISRALSKHGLDVSTFNLITAEVEDHSRLRGQVRQLIMEEKLSILGRT
jgi:hypothetical protein